MPAYLKTAIVSKVSQLPDMAMEPDAPKTVNFHSFQIIFFVFFCLCKLFYSFRVVC